MAIIITIGNFKGGVAKTMNTGIIGYTLSKMGKKVLLIDFDPQKNLTDFILQTRRNINDTELDNTPSFMKCIAEGNIEPALISINDDLDIIPAYEDLINFPLFVEKEYSINDRRRLSILDNLLRKLMVVKKYDYIVIDTPPTISIFSDNALCASTHLIMPCPAQASVLAGSDKYIAYVDEMLDTYNLKLNLIGILVSMYVRRSSNDKMILEEMKERYGENNIFNTIIPYSERIKRWCGDGIDNKLNEDYHEEKTKQIYIELVKEIMERIGDKIE